MGFFLTDPFSHTSMTGLIEKRAEKTVFRTEDGDQQVWDPWTNQATTGTLYDCYHYVLDASTASDVDSAWRIRVVAGDVAVVSFWTLPTAGHWVLKTDFFHEDAATNTWTKVPDSFNYTQYIAINVSTTAALDAYISTTVSQMDAFYGTHTSPADYDTCFYTSEVWQRTFLPEWTSADSTCETCAPGTGGIPLKILIYKWTKGSDVEYRTSTNCSPSRVNMSSTDLVSLQSQVSSELTTRAATCEVEKVEAAERLAAALEAEAEAEAARLARVADGVAECVSDLNCEEGYICVNKDCVERIEGCTDRNSKEYDSAANTDNNSCVSCVAGYIKDDEGLCTNCDSGYEKNNANKCISEEEETAASKWMLIALLAGASIMVLS